MWIYLVFAIFGAGAFGQAPQRYIDVNEVRPGMEAYCLTVYQGTEVERFALDVVDVVSDFQPDLDVILVQGTDERFLHTGSVAGCSGSPVYIDGRLAGALAFGWPLSKDPLYGVTPIHEMLRIGQSPSTKETTMSSMGTEAWVQDWQAPIDVNRLGHAIMRGKKSEHDPLLSLQCPLMYSGFNRGGQKALQTIFAPYGFLAVPGVGGGGYDDSTRLQRFVPGSVMMVPLVDGDVRLAVLGTVTEVIGDRIYGFGHSFLGQGPLELPLATGRVHTIVSNLSKSFKLGSVGETVGVLTEDESTGVVGTWGGKAQTIPMTLRLQDDRVSGVREFNCEIAQHRLLTIELIKAVLSMVPASVGTLPMDHTVSYEVSIALEGDRSIQFKNQSSNSGLNDVMAEVLGSVALMLQNPFEAIDIQSIEVNLKVVSQSRLAYLVSLEVPDREYKAGDVIVVKAVLEGFRRQRRTKQFTLTIPQETQPGNYDVIVGGGYQYQQYLRQRVPYRLMADNIPSLFEALNYSLSIPRAGLVGVLSLKQKGVALERHELPRLPDTRALILESTKKTVTMSPYLPWVEKRIDIDDIVVNGQRVRIKVLP